MEIFNFKFKKTLSLRISFTLLAFFIIPLSNATVLAVENNSDAFFFNKNLKIGDKGEDVKFLQQMLNNNPNTIISLNGAGSPGNETDFFGALTKNSVIKFQELYASEILEPLGLQKGTGVVGIATRLKLSSLIEISELGNQSGLKAGSFSSSSSSFQSVSQNASSENNNSSSSESSSEAFFFKSSYESAGVRVYSTSEYQIKPGTLLSVAGEGFAPMGNIIHIGEKRTIRDIKTDSSSSLSFTVPQDLPTGEYSIWVENENGISKNQTFEVFFVVSNNPAERPFVEKVSPPVALYDGEVTISGSGFTSSGNSVYSSFGNALNLPSSDGGTLKLKISSLSEIYRLQKVNNLLADKEFKGWLYVQNGSGINKKPVEFSVKF